MSFDLSAQLQKTLGANYRLERELGGGGMSRVFLAHEVALGRKVVVKVLLPELAAGVSVDRFRREIQLAAQLQHPHIVPLLSAGEADGLPYFTMPYITGESLAVKIARTGELPVSETVRILRDVASALGYAHEYGVVHRDIKPANVLLSGGVAVVTDFGVAKAVSASTDADTTHLTSIGMAIGTPAYMAPEQASGDPHVDHRADIYSVGVLTYEMLAGRTPFSGRPSSAVLAAHVVELPEAVDHRRPGIPPMLATLVMECLAKRPADRPQSAAAIIDVLDMLSTPSGGAVPATTVVRAPQAPAAPRRVPVGTVAAATLAVLGGGALWLYAGRGGGERQASPPAVDVRPRPVESAPARDSLPVASATREPTPAASTVPDSAAAPVVPAPAPVERRADPGRRARPGAQVRGSADRAPPRQAHRPEGAGAPIPSRIDSAPADAARAPAPAGAPAARTAPAESVGAAAPPPPPAVPAPAPAPAHVTPAPPPPPPPAAHDPRPDIRAVLAEYATAVESQNVGNIRRLYPGMTPSQERGWRQFFEGVRDVKAQLSVASLDVANGTAEAQMTGTYTYQNTSTRTTDRQPVAFHVSLRLERDGWRISEVR